MKRGPYKKRGLVPDTPINPQRREAETRGTLGDIHTYSEPVNQTHGPNSGIQAPPNTPTDTNRRLQFGDAEPTSPTHEVLRRAICNSIMIPRDHESPYSSDDSDDDDYPIQIATNTNQLSDSRLRIIIPSKAAKGSKIVLKPVDTEEIDQLPRGSEAWHEAHGRQNGLLIDQASGFDKLKSDPATAWLYDKPNPEPEIGGDRTCFLGKNHTITESGVLVPEGMTLTKDGELAMADGSSKGRGLAPWHKPRMIEKAFLALIYELHRRGVEVPYNEAMMRVMPNTTGSAFQQALNKLRDRMLAEGHLIPPQISRVNIAVDAHIRGYVRDMESENPFEARILTWDEDYVHLDKSLKPENLVTGSGNNKKNGTAIGMGRTLRFQREARQRAENARAQAAGEAPKIIRRDRVPEAQRKLERVVKRRKIAKLAIDKAASAEADNSSKSMTLKPVRNKYGTRSKTGVIPKLSYKEIPEDPFVDHEDEITDHKTIVESTSDNTPGRPNFTVPGHTAAVRTFNGETSPTPSGRAESEIAKLRPGRGGFEGFGARNNSYPRYQTGMALEYGVPSNRGTNAVDQGAQRRSPAYKSMVASNGLPSGPYNTPAGQGSYYGYDYTSGSGGMNTPSESSNYMSSPYMTPAMNDQSPGVMTNQGGRGSRDLMSSIAPAEWLRNDRVNFSGGQANGVYPYNNSGNAIIGNGSFVRQPAFQNHGALPLTGNSGSPGFGVQEMAHYSPYQLEANHHKGFGTSTLSGQDMSFGAGQDFKHGLTQLADAAVFAGNELGGENLEQNVATGFNYLGGVNTFPNEVQQNRVAFTGVVSPEEIAAWNAAQGLESHATNDVYSGHGVDHLNGNHEHFLPGDSFRQED